MTTDEILERLQKIKDIAGDDEAAHGAEDDLYATFIAYVATDPEDVALSDKAKLVLSTDKISFSRWCA